MFRKRHAPLLAMLLAGCTAEGGSNEEVADEESGTETSGDGDTETGDGDGTADELDGDASTDDVGDDELGDATDESADETSGDDCELGEYISESPALHTNWAQASGVVIHSVTRGVFDSTHGVSANFVTGLSDDDSKLCVEWLVADADVEVDACNVYYTEGFGLGGDHESPFEDLAVDLATFDVGAGPIALEFSPGDEFTPARYRASFAPPPAGVPFGGIATLAVTFADLPDFDLDLDVPEDLMPIAPAHASTTLSSEELASWTWSNSGGSEPVDLRIRIGATPFGSGWSELVRIQCRVTDDGEFAFPSEYLDLARERLGSTEIHAGATITRTIRGQVPLAGEDLYWYSRNIVDMGVAIVD